MKRLPNKFVIFKIIDKEEDCFEDKKEALFFIGSKSMRKATILREEWQRVRNEKGRIIGIRLLKQMKLKRL